ncbi:MAG: helix-turn-helix transcriptional regulator [Elusimicrobia bacterium]|nr:helix-turn-helix transcriptional regulator [Elusimicrobiota bacterium]
MISPLRKKRILSEQSIYEVGKKTGIDTARISLIERGYKLPREDEKKKFAEAIGCSVDEIFTSEIDGNLRD